MSSDISLQGAMRPAPRPVPIETHPLDLHGSNVEASTPEPKAVEKPSIDFDPKEAQRKLSEALSQLNEMMKNSGTNLAFSRDEVLNKTVVTVKNTETGKVVRQIPDVVFLKVAHNIDSLKGLLHNAAI